MSPSLEAVHLDSSIRARKMRTRKALTNHRLKLALTSLKEKQAEARMSKKERMAKIKSMLMKRK